MVSLLLFTSLNCWAVKLKWDANTEPNLGGYKLYYGYEPGTYDTFIDVGLATEHDVTGLALNQDYYFAVTAWNMCCKDGVWDPDTETCDPELVYCESGYSNEVMWNSEFGFVEPPTDGHITWEFIDAFYSEDFESYSIGADPTGWIDTGADNSMAENDSLFKVLDSSGNKVFGTSSTDPNIHSHVDINLPLNFEFTGRMMKTEYGGGVGVTFYSDYPVSDKYYRIRSYENNSFHVAPHPHGVVIMSGDIDSGIIPDSNVWYNFRINVIAGAQTAIKAKIWKQIENEPEQWQIDCYDDDGITAGKIGVWSARSGQKYYDDLKIN